MEGSGAQGPVEGRLKMGKIHFPAGEAFKFVIQNVSRRFVRTVLTMSGVILSMAFFTTLILTGAAYSSLYGSKGAIRTYYWWMLFLAILVSATGITNSVLMAVAERTREIGTMKTLGAMSSHILSIFIIENAIIGAIGGLIGYVGGLGAALVLNRSTIGLSNFLSIPAVRFLEALGYNVAMATFLAIGMSAYPAYRASRLNPVDALRSVA